MKEIEITINPDGTAEIELDGFKGKGCSQAMDELLKGLDAKIVKRSKKCDYYQQDVEEKVKQKRA